MWIILVIIIPCLAVQGCGMLNEPPRQTVELEAGEGYCTSNRLDVCARLNIISLSLHTPAMNAAIAAAKPGIPRE